MAAYAALREEAVGSGAKIFFADEAHFRADAELRGRWVLRGEPALVNSSSPRYGEKASYYSAVCLETGEVEWMDLEGNSNSGTSAAFLDQLPYGKGAPSTSTTRMEMNPLDTLFGMTYSRMCRGSGQDHPYSSVCLPAKFLPTPSPTHCIILA